MNPFTVCLSVALLQGGLASSGPSAGLRHWEDFKALHNKQHAAHLESARMAQFSKTRAEIEAHNERFAAGLESFSMKLNQYSDLSPSEFRKVALGFTPHPNDTAIPTASPAPMGNVPASLDYRQTGIMTPVRDQGGCGSCYAFAAGGVLESYILRTSGQVFDLSEQDVVDCSYRNFMGGQFNGGCQGGHPTAVFDYYNRKDIVMENSYPYQSGQSGSHHQCRAPDAQYRYLGGGLRPQHTMLSNEMDLKFYLANYGPLVIGMAADNENKAYFQHLGDGIFDTDSTIHLQPNHVVVLMGYGQQNGKQFWIIKNSWGTTWGNGGYGRIIAGKNMANIMTSGIWYLQ